jgi:hypothetical protein
VPGVTHGPGNIYIYNNDQSTNLQNPQLGVNPQAMMDHLNADRLARVLANR